MKTGEKSFSLQLRELWKECNVKLDTNRLYNAWSDYGIAVSAGADLSSTAIILKYFKWAETNSLWYDPQFSIMYVMLCAFSLLVQKRSFFTRIFYIGHTVTLLAFGLSNYLQMAIFLLQYR